MTTTNAWRDLRVRLPWLGDLVMLPVLIVMVCGFAIFNPGILSPLNLTNVLSQTTVIAIAAIGATFVILTAGIDLSTGSTISAAGVASAAVIHATGSIPLGILAGVATGVLAGFLLGLFVAYLKLVPFVVTLAGLFAISGVTLLLTTGATVSGLPDALAIFSITTFGGIPAAALIAIVLFAAAQFALTRTVWGRHVILVGANREVARVSGIHVTRVTVSVYIVGGLFSAIAGVILTANLSGANASMGSPLLLNVIGAVVLGGTSLFGGRGSILRTAIGALLLGFLADGMTLIGLQSYDQEAVTGVVILLAASLDALLHRGNQ
jgi:ribose transport system permease protein